MPKTPTPTEAKRPNAVIVSVTLRPDRVAWIRQTAQTKGVSISEIVRDAIDEARRQAERESMTA